MEWMGQVIPDVKLHWEWSGVNFLRPVVHGPEGWVPCDLMGTSSPSDVKRGE